MVLEELHELIETLQARIDAHAPALQQSEALTRYGLIDPLLRGLGWDTSDPAQVVVEYRSAAGSADYALFGQSSTPTVIVEAKKLGTQLDAKVLLQVTGYCQQAGIPYAAITDGQHWELYDVFKPAAMADSIVIKLDLTGQAAQTCLDALALWHPSVVEGTVSAGAGPIVKSPEPAQPPPSVTTTPVSVGPDWHRLNELGDVKGKKPSEIWFPDGQTLRIATFANLTAQVVMWLIKANRLTGDDLPIQRPKAKVRYIVAKSPVHPTGRSFVSPHLVEFAHVDLHYNSNDQIFNSQLIIKAVGLDPSDFAVRLQ